MPYVPSATDTAEPTIGREVRSAAEEFRTVKSYLQTQLGAIAADSVSQDARLDAIEALDVTFDSRLDNLEATALVSGVVAATILNQFAGNGVTLAFGLTVPPAASNLVQVYVGGLKQQAGSWSVAGSTLTFTEAPPAPISPDLTNIEVVITTSTASADAAALRTQLASAASGNGGEIVAADPFTLNYVAKTVAGAIQGGMPSIWWVLTDAEIADVKAYGYTNDLTAKIQSALDKWPHWWFPPGGYKISTLLFKSNSRKIFGAAPSLTIIKSTATAIGDTALKSDNQSTATRLFCGLENIQIMADLLPVGYVVDWMSFQFGRIRNVWVYGGGAGCTGIRLNANWTVTECTYNHVTDCYIGNIGKGISWGDGANTNTCTNNRIQPLATGYGYFLFGTAAGRISNNNIDGGGVEFAGAVSRGVFAGQGVDVLTIKGVRFEFLAVGIESTAQANEVVEFGNYFSSCTSDRAMASTKSARYQGRGLVLPNSTTTVPNELSWYESTATFTPTIQGTTTNGTGGYAVNTGSFTRIGDRVFFELNINQTSHTGTGNIRIAGLPYTIKNQAFNPSFNVAAENLTYVGDLKAIGIVNTNTILIFVQASGVGLAGVAMDTNCSIYVSGSYPV